MSRSFGTVCRSRSSAGIVEGNGEEGIPHGSAEESRRNGGVDAVSIRHVGRPCQLAPGGPSAFSIRHVVMRGCAQHCRYPPWKPTGTSRCTADARRPDTRGDAGNPHPASRAVHLLCSHIAQVRKYHICGASSGIIHLQLAAAGKPKPIVAPRGSSRKKALAKTNKPLQ